ncbi:MAG TPA: TetR family transcriptional regulator [Ramlibacter sp.]|jgi:AcrR family transcriptional regulator|uniref:TetR/AcrR family transcriptional regulator n=1 Tax=Ramlibacter sp. TaxID=1917967 RepID=UPI002D3DC4C0|nr:TetR family transcriptional regulator [Ramlibacter sp.]HZY19216.1 TetR family transcriptional regulator [Ramlibacter sp.]
MLKKETSRAPEPPEPLRKSQRTRAAILDAARRLFAERGPAGTTVRDIAAAAGADPALVVRYFGSKEALFVAATHFELHLPDLDAGAPGSEGETLVRHFFEVWEHGPSAPAMTILLRSAVADAAAAETMRQVFAQQLMPAVRRSCPGPDASRRAGLIASQMLGVALCRYILKIPAMATASPDDLVPLLAPVLQRYLTQPV